MTKSVVKGKNLKEQSTAAGHPICNETLPLHRDAIMVQTHNLVTEGRGWVV